VRVGVARTWLTVHASANYAFVVILDGEKHRIAQNPALHAPIVGPDDGRSDGSHYHTRSVMRLSDDHEVPLHIHRSGASSAVE
jgi:hypothetical protein